jgi:hypothetical protein
MPLECRRKSAIQTKRLGSAPGCGERINLQECRATIEATIEAGTITLIGHEHYNPARAGVL